MNIAIVDDLSSESDALRNILNEYAAINRLTFAIDIFPSGEDFLRNFSPFSYAVIFMDIYMTGMTGVETAKKVRESDRDTLLVFLTTSGDHRADAFSIHAYDYIEKPTKKDKLFRVMDDILQNHTTLFSDKLSFIADGQDYALPYPDILSVVTAQHNYLEIADRFGNTYQPRMTFSTILKELDKDSRFLQINRNILVNLEQIEALKDGMCLLKNGASFPIHSKKTKEIEQKWQNFMFSRIRKNNQERGLHL